MTFFSINHDEAQDFTPIPVGSYEVVISEAEITETGTGKPMLKLKHTIRNDVDQPARKRILFDNLVVSEKAMFRFQNIAKATAMPNGASFGSADELLKGFQRHLKGRTLRITVKHDNSRDNFIEQVSGYSPSQIEGGAPGSNPFHASNSGDSGQADPFADQAPWASSQIKDEDLPF